MAETTLKINTKSMIVKVGKPQQIPFTYSGSGAATFKSSNEAVCKVSAAGVALPIKAGIVVVTASAPGCGDVTLTVQVTL